MIAKNFNGYIVFIVLMKFLKNFSMAKIFPSKFSAIFQRERIPLYSKFHYSGGFPTMEYPCHELQDEYL